MSSLESNFTTATEMFKQVFEQVAKNKLEVEEEKQKWEEEKVKIHSAYSFQGQVIDLNVGGTRYSTSRSTLTKYPDSMLGVMFSGRHDLETMKCSDGSFFIDRDGTHFRHILNYLRDGEDVIESFPKSAEVLREILREVTYYQLENLAVTLKPLVRRLDIVLKNDIAYDFISVSGYSCYTDYGGACFTISSHSIQAILYKMKNMRGLSFAYKKFLHPVSFISCDLSKASFTQCEFGSNVTFEDCILDNTEFSHIKGLVTNSHKVCFTGSKTENTNFESTLRTALKSAGKIVG